jgi:hypothetical protein
MATPLTNEDLRYMEEGLTRPDLTLTPYWESRVRLLIAEVKESRVRWELHELANGGCVPKPAYDELAGQNAYLANAVRLLQEGPR